MRTLLVLATILVSLEQPAEAASAGCAMLAKGKSSSHAVNVFYGSKAVEILRAAKANDRNALGQAVGPSFIYTVTDGDSIMVPRQTTGIDAAILLAQIIEPKSYRIETVYNGPVWIASRGCQWTVKVVFNSARASGWPDAFAVDFAFSEDRLMSATGDSLQVAAGTLSSLPD